MQDESEHINQESSSEQEVIVKKPLKKRQKLDKKPVTKKSAKNMSAEERALALLNMDDDEI